MIEPTYEGAVAKLMESVVDYLCDAAPLGTHQRLHVAANRFTRGQMETVEAKVLHCACVVPSEHASHYVAVAPGAYPHLHTAARVNTQVAVNTGFSHVNCRVKAHYRFSRVRKSS